MVMLAEHYDFVIGGDPDRDTVDLAVLDTGAARVHAHVADTADGPGYRRMLTWAGENAPGRRIWALEGTGSFAAGLVVLLAQAVCGRRCGWFSLAEKGCWSAEPRPSTS